MRFESFARLEQMGKTPNPDHYEAVYFANTPAYFYGMSNAEALEELYLTFNLKRPAILEDTASRSAMWSC